MRAAETLRGLARLLHLRRPGTPAAAVHAIRCPWCRAWVKPARFDLRHMACHACVTTLHRPPRKRTLFLGEGVRWCR